MTMTPAMPDGACRHDALENRGHIMPAVSLPFPRAGVVLLTVIALDYLIVRLVTPLKRALR
jgi:hypothetical protein